MINSYTESVAPGTQTNRARQAKSFVKFAVLYNVDHLSPTETDICMYAQYLKNAHSSPQSVKNYISGAKTWVGSHGGNILGFMSKELEQLTKGFVKNSEHVPARAAPLSLHHLLAISCYAISHPYVPLSVMPCLVIGYKCFLRSSNLLSPSAQVWGGAHTLLAKDIVCHHDRLIVTIRSTKTKSDNNPDTFSLLWEPDARLCPVQLWTNYLNVIKPWQLGPAFLTNDLLPLTPRIMVGVMRAALASATDIDAAKVSLHSIRRGAAQNAAERGVELPYIKTLGLWKSDSGLKPYLIRSPQIFNR